MNKIYKRTQTGAIQQWEIIVEGNAYHTQEGQVGGKLTCSSKTFVQGKNLGKSNETSPEEQAIKEAQAKWDKKVEKGYTEDIKKIDSAKKFFEPMLSHKFKDYKDNIQYPVYVSPKLDGCRMVATKDGLFTRNGKRYETCPHIINILKPIFNKHPNWILDGEVYTHSEQFEKIVSLVRIKKPSTQDLKDSEQLIQYWIFDGVVDNTSLGFDKRFAEIKTELKTLNKNNTIKIVENEPADTFDEVIGAHELYVGAGYEGVMVRAPSAPYENKRSKNLLKYKTFLDDEFKIVDIEEGSGNRSGMAGKILFNTKSGKTFGAGIRGGEEYYKTLLLHRGRLIGKTATVRYQNLTEDGIPRFPIVINVEPFDR